MQPTTPQVTIPYGIQGNGAGPEASTDYRLAAPLYVPCDACAVGSVTLSGGNQVVLAITSAHTYAGGANVSEAGLVHCVANPLIYLSANNIQLTRNTFAPVVIAPGGTFTATYTLTIN